MVIKWMDESFNDEDVTSICDLLSLKDTIQVRIKKINLQKINNVLLYKKYSLHISICTFTIAEIQSLLLLLLEKLYHR